jgi:hypothetical protein
VTRTLPVNYKRLTRSAAGPVMLVILLATLVLCLSNFGLTKYAVMGILAGIIFWKWPLWMRDALGAAIVIVFLTACSLNEARPPQFYWAATYHAQITLNSSGKIWTINKQVTIPGDTLRQITEGNGKFAVILPPPGPDQYQQDIKKFTQMIKPYGLTFVGAESGTDPIYSFPSSTLTHRIPTVPLVTAQTVDLPYLTLPGSVNVIPGDDSKVYIYAPSGVVEATTPTSQAGPTTTGEERVIDVGSFSNANTGSVNVSISTLSVLARDEPLRSMAGLSLAGGISWAIAAIWALLTALAQTGAQAAAASGWKRIRRTKAQPDAEKADQKDEGNKPAEPQKPPAPAAG